MKKRRALTAIIIAVIAALLALCLSACGAGQLSATEDTKGEAPTYDSENGVSLDERKLIKNYSLSAETKTFDDFVSRLEQTVNEYGGYVGSSSVSGNSYSSVNLRRAYYTLRIPADKSDDFVASVKGFSNVTNESTSVDDVTLSYVDLESRLKALRTEESSLLVLLDKSDNLDSIMNVQSRLTEVRYQIESYEAQKRALDNSINYATVNINILEVAHETVAVSENIWSKIGSNLVSGFENVWNFLVGLFVFLVSALPYLLLIAVFAGIVLLIIYLIKKSKKKE